MSTVTTVKTAIINLLRADADIQAMLGKDRRGNIPVYAGFEEHKIHKPCITVDDVAETAEVSALNDDYDGQTRREWCYLTVQIDCWAGNRDLRDQLATQIRKVILKGQATLRTEGGVIMISPPSVTILDEPDARPPIWRKSLRYRLWYVLEA